MLWPTVTELPRKLEPTTGDTFMQDLNALTPPPAPQPADEPPRARRE
jgi:hypothetical protein